MSIGWVPHWVVGGWAVVASLLWVVSHVRAARTLLRLPQLGDAALPAPEPWPRLSIVIPACNEAATLEAAISTLLSQDHPDLEVVIVDDRSTDGTGAIADRIAAADPRVQAVHVDELPDGWLGKVHALHVGARHTTGDWVLFTDADVHYAPGTLRKAHALAVARRIDMLVLIPELRSNGLLHEAVVDAFGGMLMQSIDLAAVADPASDAYVGSGAFNLVRRAVWERSEGFHHIRLEVADDVGVGLVMKRAGARQEVWLASREVKVLWYPSLGAMARGLEKNLFAVVGQYRVWRVVVRLLGLAAIVVGPFVGLFHSPVAAVAGVLAFACLPAFGLVLRRRLPGHRMLPTLLVPLGQVLLMYMVVRSTWVCLRRGSIEWRGTRYPLDRLAAHQKVKV